MASAIPIALGPDLTGRLVTRLRVVVNTKTFMGSMTHGPGSHFTPNHWSFYLVNPDGESVNFNMEWTPALGTDMGKFTTARHEYPRAINEVHSLDFEVPSGVTVLPFLSVVYGKEHHMYPMSPRSADCRHWIWGVFKDWCEAGLVSTTDATHKLADAIRFNYSSIQAPIQIETNWLNSA